MSGTAVMTVGDRGRVVIPQADRERWGFTPGTKLVLLETPGGPLLLTRDQLLDRVQADFAGHGELLAELLDERRAEARAEAEL
ncbi:MAG: AbrB/MazE/SpoVT family DNA-binding domain-containing protein [Bifidobacteriaceae bacterium]|jgi:AbrB family looped-hinge helix DNA binding protein|nr:AbrB/MazE/SpoVT family DNA-binding domain-containing protein [Bifidobacteriaceae bacterium]